MLNVKQLISSLQSQAAASDAPITVNIINLGTGSDTYVDGLPTDTAPVYAEPDTDFEVGDRVIVCHTKKDGSGTIHPQGTVIEVLGQDDDGYYTRIEGDNGKHYRTGLKVGDERKGSKVIFQF